MEFLSLCNCPSMFNKKLKLHICHGCLKTYHESNFIIIERISNLKCLNCKKCPRICISCFNKPPFK